ncbi:MAG: PP2C family protein-serine/threonine phosphatase, partial [Tissierellia bacterium]|nr:PP2C family protein-serine/threonine phosphatase [Tissierellia bacterium]
NMIGKAQDEKYDLIIIKTLKKEFKHIKENWLLLLVCFFVSRQNIIDDIFPFAIVVLSSYCYIKGSWISILFVCIAGILSVRFDFVYIIMLTAIYGYYFNSRNEGKKSILLVSGYSAAVLFFSKTAILVAEGFNSNEFMLNVFETMFIFSAIILINEGFKTIKKLIKDKSGKIQRVKNKKKEDISVVNNNAENEVASTVSYTSANKNKSKKKNKYLNIFSDDAKKKVTEQLLWQNINVKFFEVISCNKSSILLSLTVKTEKTPEEAESTIALIVRNISGAKLRCVERIVVSPNYYVLKFKNIKKIKIRTYSAATVKDGSEVSGDNFAYAGRADKYYMVLCDGIGSGEEANNESNGTVDLMSRFLYSDFTEEQILRTLNSVLMIKLGDERYVTFDFTIIDHGTKEIRLYKAGAAPSYILSGKNVDKISGKSLPMGILDNFEYSSFKKKINMGDMIVMVTDGIIDSISLDPKKSLDKYLEYLAGKDPQTVANSILSYALRGQDRIIDDMTVLVTKIG